MHVQCQNKIFNRVLGNIPKKFQPTAFVQTNQGMAQCQHHVYVSGWHSLLPGIKFKHQLDFSSNTRKNAHPIIHKGEVPPVLPVLLVSSLPRHCLSQRLVLIPDCSTCSYGFVQRFGYVCRECSQAEKNLAIGMAAVVYILLLLGVICFVIHVEGMVSNGSREKPAKPPGLIRRTLTRCRDIATKALPVATIKIVVVVWQILYQVRIG